MTRSEPDLASPPPSYEGILNPRGEWMWALTRRINPYCSVSDRDRVIGALCQATGGSGQGLKVAHEWCRVRSDYSGEIKLLVQWNSLEKTPNCSDGFAVLCQMAHASGFDPLEICSETEPQFEPCEYTIFADEAPRPTEQDVSNNALAKYSLKGRRDAVARTAADQVHVLGRLALSNQLTAIYGPPAIGKTAITLSLVAEAITQGRIRAKDIYYLDFDTSATGLLEKLDFAENYGFNVLSDGYFDFSSRKFIEVLDELIAKDQAIGTLVILDTLKKFTNLMDKDRSSSFANRLRRFSKAGGACVALAHVNKHGNSEGKPIHAGTSDILEDFDCAYLMYQVAVDPVAQTRTVLFESIKARGAVARQASFRYSIAEGLTYRELLESVTPLDETELAGVRRAEERTADVTLIDAISACIRSGVVAKMAILEAAAKQTKVSQRTIGAVLDRYCGGDPAVHLWDYTVHEHNARKYKLLTDSMIDGDEEL